jgi:hypothetical protein
MIAVIAIEFRGQNQRRTNAALIQGLFCLILKKKSHSRKELSAFKFRFRRTWQNERFGFPKSFTK